jgi:hypothetical protein
MDTTKTAKVVIEETVKANINLEGLSWREMAICLAMSTDPWQQRAVISISQQESIPRATNQAFEAGRLWRRWRTARTSGSSRTWTQRTGS